MHSTAYNFTSSYLADLTSSDLGPDNAFDIALPTQHPVEFDGKDAEHLFQFWEAPSSTSLSPSWNWAATGGYHLPYYNLAELTADTYHGLAGNLSLTSGIIREAEPELAESVITAKKRRKHGETEAPELSIEEVERFRKKGRADRQIFICPVCNATFTRIKNRDRHISIHSPPQIKCTGKKCGCGRSFNRKDSMQRHQNLQVASRRRRDCGTIQKH